MSLKKAWVKLVDGTKAFSIAHVQSVFYNYASNILLKDKLDEMDALIDAKIAKAMMSSIQVNSESNVPTSALAYSMQQAITENANGISQLNSDFGFTYLLNKGTRILAGADMKSDIYKIPGNYYCDLTANVATLQNCPVTNAFILKVEYGNGTSYPKQIFKEYDTGKIISRTYYPSQDRWYDEVTYVRSSDLGKVIANSGTVAAVKGQENEIASITLPAGHKYLVLASTSVSINLTSAIMSCKIAHKSGAAKEQLGTTNVRTTMSSGGGITNWYYINTTTDCVCAVCGYGYADAEYDYTGNIIAIQLD